MLTPIHESTAFQIVHILCLYAVIYVFIILQNVLPYMRVLRSRCSYSTFICCYLCYYSSERTPIHESSAFRVDILCLYAVIYVFIILRNAKTSHAHL